MVAIASIIVLFVLLIFLLPYLLDLNSYRDQYLPVLERMLHRKVAVGDVRLTIWPTLGVRFREVSISDDSDFSSTQFLTVPHVQVAVRWKPLLQRRIEVKSVVVEHPIMQVIRSSESRFNFSTMGTIPTTGQIAPEQKESQNSVSPLFGILAVKQFLLTDGSVQVEDRTHQPSKVYRIENLTMTTESVAIGETAHLHINGMVMPFKTPVDVKGRLGPLQANLDIPTLAIEGLVGKVAVRAKGNIIDGRLTTDIEVPKASTEDLAIVLGLNKPIEISRMQVHLTAPLLHRDQRTNSSEVQINPLRVNLQIGQSLIHILGKGTPSHFSLQGDAATFSSNDFPVALPVRGPFALEQVEFTAEVHKGAFYLQSFNARALKGSLMAQGVLDPWSLPFRFSTQGTFKDFSTEALLKVATASSLRLTGSGAMDWNIQGSIPSSTSPILDGPMHVTIRDGAIMGFDLTKVIEEALQLSGVIGLSPGTTQFSLIDGQSEFEKDGLTIKEFVIHSPNFFLQGRGKAGLDQSLKVKGKVSVSPGLAAQIIQRFPMVNVMRQEGRLVLPFVVQGTVQEPIFRLDSRSLGSQVQKKVEERIEKVLEGDDQELQKLLDEGKDLLKQFFRK